MGVVAQAGRGMVGGQQGEGLNKPVSKSAASTETIGQPTWRYR